MIQSHCYCLSGIVITIYCCFLIPTLASPTFHFCRHDQRKALLEFRDEFPMDESNASPWNKSSDCCHWKGVRCDNRYGQVISLDLSWTFLNSSLKANSSLFRLHYLRHLNLSWCFLQGNIPSSLGNLSHLTLIDLSENYLVGEIPTSIGYLNNLRELSFEFNNLRGEIPSSLGNLSRLRLVDLSRNNLIGEIPASIGYLNNLRELRLWSNNLTGEIPSSLGNLSHLTLVDLSENYLVGEIPVSIGYLNNLRELSLGSNNLTGEIPSSIKNLSSLTYLSLSTNLLVGEVPASIGNLNGLRVMHLGHNRLSGKFPISFANLTKLTDFGIYSNKFTSTLPDMSGFHNLERFDVSENSFIGPFPKSLFSIPSVQWLYLGKNQFTGPIELGNTSLSSFELKVVDLSYNRFDGSIPEYISEFVNLTQVYLDHNDFTGSIPRSLSKLANLGILHLSYNRLTGEVPSFVWKNMGDTLSHNLFSSLENTSQETDVLFLDLSSNLIRGPFPHWICNIKELDTLDLSNNFFTGLIPSCLRNFMVTLTELSLSNNSFSGVLPDIFVNATSLLTFDVSRNQLEGKFPKSLINCKALELVNVESNNFKDKFPSWLGSLPSLRVLSLKSNKFYGPLYHHRHKPIGFQRLRVIDVSHNDFTGTLPPYYFFSWRDMTTLTQGDDDYMSKFSENNFVIYRSIELVLKGVDMRFERIREDFRAIDFSGNRFYGEIPTSIGFLKELRLLNMSHNSFTDDIPRSLANLTSLETLDLSSNNLSGEIPQDLGKLSFLSYVNFSHNRLHGPVPRGTQFQRQNCSSFTDNPGLFNLQEICGERHAPEEPTSQQHEDLSEEEEKTINWIAAAIAYVPGLFCGVVIGYIFTSYKQEWFGRRKLRVTTIAR